jgi:hypothetical protein
MRSPLLRTFLLVALSLVVTTASVAEISIRLNADDSVLVKSGYDAEEINFSNDDAISAETARLTVAFPEESPVVYELESEEDFEFLVDGSLPDDADVLLEAEALETGLPVEDFEHVLTGGDWTIAARYMTSLPPGEVKISATLRVPGRRAVTVTHPFYVLKPGQLRPDEQSPWFDWEFDGEGSFPALVPGEGFMPFEAPSGSSIYYVSASGSDSNPGTSPDRPLRTARAAYEKIRDRSSDWILFKAGESFSGGFGSWKKSGKSPDQPLHVGVYGEGDRPIINTNGGSFIQCFGRVDNVRIDGIHAYANDRANAPRENGIAWIGKGKNIVLHDVKVENFSFNLVFQGFSAGDIENLVLYRCIINNAWSNWKVGHSSGIFASYVDGLQVIESTFDRNGWHPSQSGAGRTKFNHNLYVQYTCGPATVSRSVITRGGSHGVQMRPGGDIIDNLFVSNAMAFFVTWRPSNAINNVILSSDDISRTEIRGKGIEIMPTAKAVVSGNIIARKAGNAGWMPAIDIVYNAVELQKAGGQFVVEMHDNVVWDWWMSSHQGEIQSTGAAQVTRRNNAIDGALTEKGGRVIYNDPSRGMQKYGDGGGLEEFLRNAVLRPRGTWDDTYTAPTFNNYMREGFTPVNAGGSGGTL